MTIIFGFVWPDPSDVEAALIKYARSLRVLAIAGVDARWAGVDPLNN